MLAIKLLHDSGTQFDNASHSVEKVFFRGYSSLFFAAVRRQTPAAQSTAIASLLSNNLLLNGTKGSEMQTY